MKKILKYEIVTADTKEALVQKINDMIKQNWQPLGGLAIASNFEHSQALVKYEN